MFMTHDSVWGTSMVKPPDFISNSCCREQLDGAKFLSLVPDLLNTIWISMTSMSCRLRQDVQLLENYLNKDDAHLDASCLTQTQPRSWLYMLFLAWKSVCIHYYPIAHVPSHSPWLKFGSSPTDWYRVPYVWTAFGWGPWSRLCCPKRQHPVREAESCQRWFWNHLYSHKLPSWAGNYIQCAQIHQVGFSRACRNLTAVALRTGTLANLPILMPRASFGCTTEHSQPKPWKQVRHTKSTPAQAKKTAAYVFKIYVTVHFRLG